MEKENLNRYREEEKEMETDEIPMKEEEKSNNEEWNKLKEEFDKMSNSYVRLYADFENYKKRTTEERIKERKYANQSLLEQLVAVIDIFDKTINMKTDDPKLKNFLIGFEMINQNFKTILEKEGVKKIVALGAKFDPNFHHAYDVSWDENKEEDIILEEIQSGYTYKDRLLRPSLVKVNKNTKGNEENE